VGAGVEFSSGGASGVPVQAAKSKGKSRVSGRMASEGRAPRRRALGTCA